MADELNEDVFGENGSGPGFVLGLLLGAIAGAAAAVLFAPATGEEMRHRVAAEASGAIDEVTSEPGDPGDRMRAVLENVRSRVRQASEEASAAAQETEERMRSRYEELAGGQGETTG